MSRFRSIPLFAALAALTSPALAQTHPMDALTGAEIRAATVILKADPCTRDATYQLITLKEPAKTDVLAWKPGTPLHRMARVTAVAGTRILETDVDLTGKSVTGIIKRTGIEPPLTIRVIPLDDPDEVVIAETTAVIESFHERSIHVLQPVVRSSGRVDMAVLRGVLAELGGR